MTQKPKNSIILALAVILLELIGGMQIYLSQLVMPIMATEFEANHLYGVMSGVMTIAGLVGLPIGQYLLQKFRLPPLLIVVTAVIAACGVIKAISPNIAVYLAANATGALFGGVLGMASIGAVALGLSGRARQLTLAFASASWVVSSIVGPAYAAWITHVLSWRWAMVCYLPLLLAIRVLMAINIDTSKAKTSKPNFKFSTIIFIVLAVSVTLIPAAGWVKIAALVGGAAVLGYVVTQLMPPGTFWDSKPRKMALAGMFFLTSSYFTADQLVALTAHDLFNFDAKDIGIVITGGGLGWALLGVYCGFRPANTRRKYRLRSVLGLAMIMLGTAAVSVIILAGVRLENPLIVFTGLWTFSGIGMGLVYLDTMNIFFDDPVEDDGITIEKMASSSVIVEQLATFMFIPPIVSVAAMSFGAGGEVNPVPYGATWVITAALGVFALMYLLRAYPVERPDSANQTMA
ncbi:MAG: MFS transporter [Microbacteriaceae bacterium]|nr:MFS transporter [Microbacteriaceae bacterium]